MKAVVATSIFMLIGLAGQALSQIPPLFTYWNVGEEVRVVCGSANWQHPSGAILSTNTSLEIHQIKDSAANPPTSTLVIKAYAAEFDGVRYSCVVGITQIMTVETAVAVNNILAGPSNFTVLENTTRKITFECQSDISAKPSSGNANWTITLDNGTTYSLTGEDSFMVPQERSAAGQYQCKLSNKAGPATPLSATGTLVIEYPPDVTIGSPLDNAVLVAGNPFEIICTSEAVPATTGYNITYIYLNGTEQLLGSPSDGKYTAAKTLTRADSGFYRCDASNSVGKGSKQITITVIVPPGPVVNASVLGNTTSITADLMWREPTDNGGGHITEYRISCVSTLVQGLTSTKQFTATNTSITLTGLESGLTYACSVTAVNGAGVGPATNVTVITQAGSPCQPKLPSNDFIIGMRNICVSWRVPCSGGSPLTSCRLLRGTTSGVLTTRISVPSDSCKADGNTYSMCNPNLTPDTQYYYAFEASNAAGSTQSEEANTRSQATPTTAPPAVITTTVATPPASESSDSNTGLIVGIVIAVVVIVIIIIVIVVYIVRERRSEGKSNPQTTTTARYTRGDDTDTKKELNYANVEIQPTNSRSSKPADSDPQTTYASVDAQKTQAAARTDESGTSTVV